MTMITQLKKLLAPLLKHKLIKILRSFLPWRRLGKRPPQKNAIQIKVVRQWTSYSCTAAVAQMVAGYHDIRLGHRKAIELTKCRPDGATLESVADALNLEYGLRFKTLKRASQVRAALRGGVPVMSHDALTYANDHAILVVGQTPKGFWIADPVPAQIYWRHERQFFKSANEFIAVSGRN